MLSAYIDGGRKAALRFDPAYDNSAWYTSQKYNLYLIIYDHASVY